VSRPILAVDGLVKRFGNRLALDHVGFRIDPGEAVGLLGPNGAGKTTLLSIVSGLLRADAGQVLVHGEPFRSDDDPRKLVLGLVPQDLALYEDAQARENLAFFAALSGLPTRRQPDAIAAALAFVGLQDRATDRVKTFSGGMKRRLNLAVALLHDPELLLLDEPTVGVDPQSRNALFDNIASLRRAGKTILYTTHYMEEVERLCDRVVILDHGRVIADDPLPALRQRASPRNRLRLDFTATVSPAHLAQLSTLAHVVAIDAANDGARLTLTLSDLGPGAASVLAWLQQERLPLTAVHTEQPSLESVFLELTGRSLRD
jgi:ABC-2 type transport system ATP-binding protein